MWPLHRLRQRPQLPAAVAARLDLTGLDISAAAIARLAGQVPDRRARLVCGDLGALPAEAVWPLVIGIQVFQHGDRSAAHAHIRAAQQRLIPGGLFCLRVNATGTDIRPEHEVTELSSGGGLTVRYLAGPKHGLLIHFFSAAELSWREGSESDRVSPGLDQRLGLASKPIAKR